jgi:DNA-binding PadR family transcriptional regulator
MPAPTEREQQILRLLDAGVQLKKRASSGDRFGAVFDFARIPQNVLGPTLHTLLRRQWLTFDKDRNCYTLTPDGREHVALRTRVRDFALLRSK